MVPEALNSSVILVFLSFVDPGIHQELLRESLCLITLSFLSHCYTADLFWLVGRYRRRGAFCNFVINSQFAMSLVVIQLFLRHFSLLKLDKRARGGWNEKKKKKNPSFQWEEALVKSFLWRITICHGEHSVYIIQVLLKPAKSQEDLQIFSENLIGSQEVKPMKKMWGSWRLWSSGIYYFHTCRHLTSNSLLKYCFSGFCSK